jgi:CIC family chloride channel protein
MPAIAKAPIDLRLLGRTLLHAAIVGAAAGLVGSLFFFALERTQHLALQELAGYRALRAHGELGHEGNGTLFRPWLLWVIPAVGALLGGVLSATFAPETQGGGGDAMIDAFHQKGGFIRRRVVFVKALASVLTLGSGGSGGREGPTMQIGAAIGSVAARYLKVDARERRVLLVAGCAAGMSAVFRTPLGAALLAVEVLYRDDFESDALIPALLASVVSYSVFTSIFGESTLFAHAAHYPFVPAFLPLYVAMAVVVALAASAFLGMLHLVQRRSATWKLPRGVRPAIGGLAVGIIATLVIVWIGPRVGETGQGFGILGGGYGAAQLAIVGGGWLPTGWRAVELLLLLGVVKLVVTSFTVGTGGSAGDFGPSLVMGGLFGGAFGHAARLIFHDPRIDPGAFALVGMGTFYGGIAHVPVSSLVMVCELAGSYDLLVPLMLAEGVAFVALRHRSLYHSQVPSKRESPAHSQEIAADLLEQKHVADVLDVDRPFVSFVLTSDARTVRAEAAKHPWQTIFPVIREDRTLLGVVDPGVLRMLGEEHELDAVSIAADWMRPAFGIGARATLREALEMMIELAVRELPVFDEDGHVLGLLDELEVSRTYLDGAGRAEHATTREAAGDHEAA